MSEEIRAKILELAVARGPEKTFCPSEVARAVEAEDWRGLMDAVRREAADLVAEGRLRMTQTGVEVDPGSARGAIRLGLPGPRRQATISDA